MSIICFAHAEQGIQRVISWDQKARKVDKELAGNIEEYQEKVDRNETEKGIDFGYRGLLLEVVECWILGKLWNNVISDIPKINAKDQEAISLSLEFFEKRRKLWVEMTEKHKPPYQFAQFGAELGLGTTCWIEVFRSVSTSCES